MDQTYVDQLTDSERNIADEVASIFEARFAECKHPSTNERLGIAMAEAIAAAIVKTRHE